MNLEEKIKEIGDYCKSKVLNNEYEFVKSDEYNATIKIDNFHFKIWIANNPKLHLDFSEFIFEQNFKDKISVFKTQKDRLKVWKTLKPLVIRYRNEFLIKEKLAELEKLKESIQKIEL